MHCPVMLDEVLDGLRIRDDGVYVDATIGGGGHAEGILKRLGGQGQFLGIDRDPSALRRSAERLPGLEGRCSLLQGRLSALAETAARAGIRGADGIVMDLGMSSFQVDDPERGFSFQHEGPLDMRMDTSQEVTAGHLVNGMSAEELGRTLWELGEERAARRIAGAIVRARAERPIRSTKELADLVEGVKGRRRTRIHPATRTFQALRMAVNDEVFEVEEGLEQGIALLKPGGRLAVISFHSGEDRRVKQCFKEHAGRWVNLQAGGRRWEGREPCVERITRKPIVPGAAEVEANPRSRSAKLRIVERKDDDGA